MIADNTRTDAYARALRQIVTPGALVVDIGTGVGIWALLACKFGAGKVYAIEPNDVIQTARNLAAENGFAERIEFIQDISSRVELPVKADIIVSDMHGTLPMFEQHLASIIDARSRLLAPGGTLIPQKESMWAVPVEAPDSYSRHTTPWENNPCGLDMRSVRRSMINQWRKLKETIKPEQLLAEPKCWAELDFRILQSPNIAGEATWTAIRSGTAHGFLVWFDCLLIDGVEFSNSPNNSELVYGNAFFPWPEPVSISDGDAISVRIRATLVGTDYIWDWKTTVTSRAEPTKTVHFKQSTFSGAPISLNRLRRHAGSYRPKRDEEGEIDIFLLGQMDGSASSAEIARRVASRFPERFATIEDALTRVGELAENYRF